MYSTRFDGVDKCGWDGSCEDGDGAQTALRSTNERGTPGRRNLGKGGCSRTLAFKTIASDAFKRLLARATSSSSPRTTIADFLFLDWVVGPCETFLALGVLECFLGATFSA